MADFASFNASVNAGRAKRSLGFFRATPGLSEADCEAAEAVSRVIRSSSFESYWSAFSSSSTARLDIRDRDPRNPWAFGNHLVVGIYLEADQSDAPCAALMVEAPANARIAKLVRDRFLGGGEGSYDVFLAWRCGCMGDHRVVYATPDDVPSSSGMHDACPRCFHAPLEIVRI